MPRNTLGSFSPLWLAQTCRSRRSLSTPQCFSLRPVLSFFRLVLFSPSVFRVLHRVSPRSRRLLISNPSLSVVLVSSLSQVYEEKRFTACGIALVMIAIHVAQEHAPYVHDGRVWCLRMYAVFFDGSTFSSLFVCLEHGRIRFPPVLSNRVSSCVIAWGCTCCRINIPACFVVRRQGSGDHTIKFGPVVLSTNESHTYGPDCCVWFIRGISPMLVNYPPCCNMFPFLSNHQLVSRS